MYSSADEKSTVLPFHTIVPTCEHIYLRQIKYPSLPPLYIKINPHDPKSPKQPLHTMTYLQQSLQILGAMKYRSEAMGPDITALRNELERGMSRERRVQMQLFVMGMEDEGQRRAAEVYLARYPGFMLDLEGNLDYGVGDRFLAVENICNREARSCLVM